MRQSMQPPDSALAREAEKACAEQGESVIGHSYRTWLYGTALAHVDRAELDPELFYAAALVHDHGIERTQEGRCFTMASAERAMRLARAANVSENDAELIADAITVHTTAGATVERDGATGVYVQQGAMADLAGMRRLGHHTRRTARPSCPATRGGRSRQTSSAWSRPRPRQCRTAASPSSGDAASCCW